MDEQKAMSKEEKREAWDFAIGTMQVDGVKPDEEYLELVEKEINGEITIDEMEMIILKNMIRQGDTNEESVCWLNEDGIGYIITTVWAYGRIKLLNNSKDSEIMRGNLWIFVQNGLIICYVRWIRTAIAVCLNPVQNCIIR